MQSSLEKMSFFTYYVISWSVRANYEILLRHLGNNVSILGEYFETEICIAGPLDLWFMYKIWHVIEAKNLSKNGNEGQKIRKKVSWDYPERMTVRKNLIGSSCC